MTERKQTNEQKRKSENPVLKDVEPGSDADETPLPEVGKTPPNPNIKQSDDAAKNDG